MRLVHVRNGDLLKCLKEDTVCVREVDTNIRFILHKAFLGWNCGVRNANDADLSERRPIR
jgi:hypothetical protein